MKKSFCRFSLGLTNTWVTLFSDSSESKPGDHMFDAHVEDVDG